MRNISYLHSATLTQIVQEIDKVRQTILLEPISPQKELQIHWGVLLERLYWSLKLSNYQLSKKQIGELLAQTKKQMTINERLAMQYKKAFDFIAHHWLANTEHITPKTVYLLHSFISTTKITSQEEKLQQSLNYLQVKPDHAVIQAATAMFQLLDLAQESPGLEKTACLLSQLVLYKYGYDCKGFYCLEEYFYNNQQVQQRIFNESNRTGNITAWLEYYAQALHVELAKTSDRMLLTPAADDKKSLAVLNDRQQAILSYLDNPQASITNMKVQRLHKVSQITASRDLAKLTTLGLVITHGKGRSVYYTKI